MRHAISHALVVLTLALAGAAWAQDVGGTRGPRHRTQRDDHTVPLNLGLVQHEKVPPLRSWVQGWALTGSRPDAYEVRCDETYSSCGMPILRTKTGAAAPLGTGSLTHTESAVPWRGMRVAVRAELRPGRIDGWAGLWLRLDDAQGQTLAFDNMQSRPIRGTGGFARYEVVLDVPQHAERLGLGVLLHGPGALWIRSLDLEAVDDTVAPTDLLGALRSVRPAEEVATVPPPLAPAP